MVPVVAGYRKIANVLEIPFLALVLEWFEPAREVIAAVVEPVVAVEDGVPVPCNVVPIRARHLVDFRPPSQQIPWESCKVGFPHSTTFSACPARFSVAPTEVILVVFSLPLACVCLPLFWPATNFS